MLGKSRLVCRQKAPTLWLCNKAPQSSHFNNRNFGVLGSSVGEASDS